MSLYDYTGNEVVEMSLYDYAGNEIEVTGNNGRLSFSRLPYQIHNNDYSYQGWCQHNIVEYNREYAMLVYYRKGHTGSYKASVVFFRGYEIASIVTCTVDGSSSEGTAFIGLYEYNGKYYAYAGKTLYESENLIDWTTVESAATLTYNAWSAYNINDTIYISYDNGYNIIGMSKDGGETVTNVTINFSTNENRNECSFVEAEGDIFAFFGKQWTTGTTTAESGYMWMAFAENGVWQNGIVSNVICNLGNTETYYDGTYIHIFAKSRLYHNDGGDASILRHYRATVENAKRGTFEYVRRIDSYNEELPRYALDSPAVAAYMKNDGTGLLVSPVSTVSGACYYQFYAINSGDVNTVLSEKHERELLSWESQIQSNEIYDLDSLRLLTYYDSEVGASELIEKGFDTTINGLTRVEEGDTNYFRGLYSGTHYINTAGANKIFIKWKCPYSTDYNYSKTYIGIIMNENNQGYLVLPCPDAEKYLGIGNQASANNSAAFALTTPKEVYMIKDGDSVFIYYRSRLNGMVKIIFDTTADLTSLTYSTRYEANQRLDEGNVPFFGGQTYTAFSELKICAQYDSFMAEYSNTTTSGNSFLCDVALQRIAYDFDYNSSLKTIILDVNNFTSLLCTDWGDVTTLTWREVRFYDDENYISTVRMTKDTAATIPNGAKYAAFDMPLSGETMPTIVPST